MSSSSYRFYCFSRARFYTQCTAGTGGTVAMRGVATSRLLNVTGTGTIEAAIQHTRTDERGDT